MKTNFDQYTKNVEECNKELDHYYTPDSVKLFRPPYGKMTSRQSRYLRSNYGIVMWDNLIGDFDPSLSASNCLKIATSNIRPGSIVVFHDSQKAFGTLIEVLPEYLKVLHEKGLKSEALTQKELELHHLFKSN